MQITKFIIRFLIWNEKANFIKTLLIFQFWLLTEKRKTKTNFFFQSILIENQFQKTKIKIFVFIFWFEIKKWISKNSFIFQFWLWKWKMKNEKFSKFVLFLNQKTNYTFGTRIFYVACLNFSIETKTKIFFLITYFNLSKIAKWHFRYTDYRQPVASY